MFDLVNFRPDAVVFDLDGTLADNMQWHARAFDDFVGRHQLPPVTMAQRRHMDGKRNSEIFPMLFGREMTREELKAFEEEKEGAYRELSRSVMKPMAGATDLLDRLADSGVPVAVATSAPRLNVAHTLSEIGLLDRFSVVVRSDEVPKGKPAPDVYLHAARVLGVDPRRCLAFEDAPVGVTAARSAGMACAAITSTFSGEVFATWDPPPTAAFRDFVEYLAQAKWLG